MTNKDNHHNDILLEDFNSKFDAIMEAVGGMQDSVKKIPKMAERLEKLESDMVAVRLATVGIGSDTKLIKIRTEKLENLQDEVNNLQKRVKVLETV